MKNLLAKTVFTVALGFFAVVSAQEAVSAEEYVEEESGQGATFQVEEGEVTPVNLLELIYQCTQPAPQRQQRIT